MSSEQTTIAVQRYLDQLAGAGDQQPAEPIVRDVLARSASRLRFLCATLLLGSYRRLAQPPLNLEADEMLGLIVERLIKALRKIRPATVRQFFALANQHVRWELNDLARRLDREVTAVELHGSRVAAPAQRSEARAGADASRILAAIDRLPDDAREVFELVRIQGMTHAEAAGVLGVASKTVQRRLNHCLVLLVNELSDLVPKVDLADRG